MKMPRVRLYALLLPRQRLLSFVCSVPHRISHHLAFLPVFHEALFVLDGNTGSETSSPEPLMIPANVKVAGYLFLSWTGVSSGLDRAQTTICT